MPLDVVDRASIEKMVRSFYAILIKDDLVGPYFVKALGNDLKNDKWYDHYKTLDKFWLMLMNGEPGYTGDPFFPHSFIGELYIETFERWLELFKIHIHEFYTPELADKFHRKAEILAEQFMYKLEIIGDHEDD